MRLVLVKRDIRDLKQGRRDGSEYVSKKMNLRSFKLNRVYLGPAQNVKCRRLFLELNS